MQDMIGLASPIAKLTSTHNNGDAVKRDSTEANGLMSYLYLAVGAEVMLISNLWVDVVLNNGAKVNVSGFLYKNSDGPRTKKGEKFPEAVVVQFHSMAEGVEPFLEGVPNTFSIPVVSAEWRIGTNYFNRKQFPLVLSWSFTIHKALSKNLNPSVNDTDNSERYCGMTLVTFLVYINYNICLSNHLFYNNCKISIHTILLQPSIQPCITCMQSFKTPKFILIVYGMNKCCVFP